MNAMLVLSLMIASAMAAPVIVSPGVQLQPATFLTAPQLQFVQQPAFLAQAAVQQEEVQEQEQQQQQQDASLRDPNNPTTDIFVHSGFPVLQSGVQQPFTLTRVGIGSSGQPATPAVQAQSAQLVAAPAQAQATQFFTAPQQQFQQQPQFQQQTAFATFPATFQTAPLQQSQPAQAQVQAQPAAATSQFTSPLIFATAQQQPPSQLTAFRTVATPFTFQTVGTQ